MLSCFTAMVATYGGTNNKVGNGFGVFFLYAFVTFYGSCIDAVSYVYCSGESSRRYNPIAQGPNAD